MITLNSGKSSISRRNDQDCIVRLKKTMKEREAYLQKQVERHQRRESVDSAGAEKEVLKMRLKKRRRKNSKMKKNRVIPKS